MNSRFPWPRLALTIVAMAMSLHASRADDLQPPPWRGGPRSTVAEWDFLTPNAGEPDGTTVTTVAGDSDGMPTATPGVGVSWNEFDDTGAWTGDTFGGTLDFDIPNWIDQEPIKYLQIQMTYDRGSFGLSPFVIQMDAFEPSGITSIMQTGVLDFPIAGSDGLFQRIEQWEIRPNPDYESFSIVTPDGVSLTQVVVDTISIPEPSAMSLAVVVGCAGGIATWRRKRGS